MHCADRGGLSSYVREGIDVVKERFLHLFRVHGFTPHMIVEVLQPHGIGLAELMDDAKLLPLLSEQVLIEQAERFAVQIDWLSAKSIAPVDTPYSRELHKNPTGLCKYLVSKCKQYDNQADLTVLFLRETGADYQAAFESDSNSGPDVGVVVRQTFKTPGGKPYHRYEAWRSVPWGCRETRLAVKVAILWLMRLEQATHYHSRFEGIEVERHVLHSICDRGGLPAEALEKSGPFSWRKHWDPRDYVEDGFGCKETSERLMALKYYGYFKMDKLFTPLEPYVRADVLAVPIGHRDAAKEIRHLRVAISRR
jgi:hypothetical protein